MGLDWKSKKIAVVYFSWGGNTRKVAEEISQKVGADIYEILPGSPYPTNYNSMAELAKKDQIEGIKPAIKKPLPDMQSYDVIFLGYPIWWYTHPMIINSFIDSSRLEGKILIPFATSGGPTIERSVRELKQALLKSQF